jgi:anti-sigma-K factor RskA
MTDSSKDLPLSPELAEMEELKALMDALPSTPRGGTMPADRKIAIRGRLIARASEAGDRGARSARSYTRVLAIAASVAVIALAAGYYNERATGRELAAGSARRDSLIAALNAVVRERDAELSALSGPSVAVMDLSSTGVHPPTARMFWDKATNRWTLFAHGLAAPKSGRTYELWLVTADKKIPAGTFKPGDDGSAVVRATYALQPADLKAIAITDEPDGGVSAPTGSVILAAKAGS